jgi:hypothetical protein
MGRLNSKSRKQPVGVRAQRFDHFGALVRGWISPTIADPIHPNRMNADCARKSDLTSESDFDGCFQICSHGVLFENFFALTANKKPPTKWRTAWKSF